MIVIRNAVEADIPRIQQLAEKVWWPTYSPILKDEQIHYMLSTIYSEKNLTDGFRNNETFLLLNDRQNTQGFISYSPWKENPGTWKINKLYVLPENHGSGYGRRLLAEVEARARTSRITHLVLNVNRHNPALQFYKKAGFDILREEDIAIGPYWMNDYVMIKDV